MHALADKIGQIEGVHFVDVLEHLQEEAMNDTPLYPRNNGHPVESGYEVIARTLAPTVSKYFPAPPKCGVFAIRDEKDKQSFYVYLVTDRVQRFSDPRRLVTANGWPGADITIVKKRDLAMFERGPEIKTVDPNRFGPSAARGIERCAG